MEPRKTTSVYFTLQMIDPYEQNDNRNNAYLITFAENRWTSNGAVINPEGDIDWYKYSGDAQDVLGIKCDVTSLLDPKVFTSGGSSRCGVSAACISLVFTGCSNRTTKSRPPVKSTL